MLPDVLFESLKARFSSNRTGRIVINSDEISEWPDGLLQRWLADKILTQTEPAQAVECNGCEQGCLMAVTIIPTQASRPARAFIACDKRDDVGRVRVAFSRLHQWQLTKADFERLQRTWIVSPGTAQSPALKRSKAPVAFRSGLERLLVDIERRAAAQRLPFDRRGMPGRKVDLQAVAQKFDPALEVAERTFDDYLDGLCAFKRGARPSDFYSKLFPEFFK